ncbi:hypothetical protein NDU88_001972 [Pleurodeles waltl]|uniref:Uncharacterized protein n=1 Tax=Pleurodeles waltl TaxID=8319 RepID=A0AAV7P5D1_PLEWA|nr:hypothetical protein NDU88_001972 [Pleurodeles waltl]
MRVYSIERLDTEALEQYLNHKQQQFTHCHLRTQIRAKQKPRRVQEHRQEKLMDTADTPQKEQPTKAFGRKPTRARCHPKK